MEENKYIMEIDKQIDWNQELNLPQTTETKYCIRCGAKLGYLNTTCLCCPGYDGVCYGMNLEHNSHNDRRINNQISEATECFICGMHYAPTYYDQVTKGEIISLDYFRYIDRETHFTTAVRLCSECQKKLKNDRQKRLFTICFSVFSFVLWLIIINALGEISFYKTGSTGFITFILSILMAIVTYFISKKMVKTPTIKKYNSHPNRNNLSMEKYYPWLKS